MRSRRVELEGAGADGAPPLFFVAPGGASALQNERVFSSLIILS